MLIGKQCLLTLSPQAMVEVEAGTPPVSHSLQFDTGSATTWIYTADCDVTTACPNNSGYNRTGYDEAASSTAEQLGTSASIEYLGGITAGAGVEDVFSIPSSSAAAKNTTTTTTSWRQTFLAATSSSFFNIPADGLLGMAFNSIADANTSTLVETLFQQDGGSLLDEPRFGLYYGTEVSDTGDGPGNGILTLGGSHEDVYADGNLTWAPLSNPADPQLWRVNMQYMTGTKPVTTGTTSSTGATTTTSTIPLSGAWGVFDTGAGRIGVPDPYIDGLYASIGMNYSAILAGDHLPLCTEFTDAWSVALHFGDTYGPVKVTLTGDMLRQPGFATGEDKYCWPPFDPSGSNGLFLFGGDFLQNFYTVFDFGGTEAGAYDAKIGFGALKDEYKVVSK